MGRLPQLDDLKNQIPKFNLIALVRAVKDIKIEEIILINDGKMYHLRPSASFRITKADYEGYQLVLAI